MQECIDVCAWAAIWHSYPSCPQGPLNTAQMCVVQLSTEGKKKREYVPISLNDDGDGSLEFECCYV